MNEEEYKFLFKVELSSGYMSCEQPIAHNLKVSRCTDEDPTPQYVGDFIANYNSSIVSANISEAGLVMNLGTHYQVYYELSQTSVNSGCSQKINASNLMPISSSVTNTSDLAWKLFADDKESPICHMGVRPVFNYASLFYKGTLIRGMGSSTTSVTASILPGFEYVVKVNFNSQMAEFLTASSIAILLGLI